MADWGATATNEWGTGANGFNTANNAFTHDEGFGGAQADMTVPRSVNAFNPHADPFVAGSPAAGQFHDGENGDDAAGHAGNQHDGGVTGGQEGNGGGCFNCGKEGHMKSECPEPRVYRCTHCGEEGHTIRRCTKPDCPPQEPIEFSGECRECGQAGHRAVDCPQRPPMKCFNCQQEGHSTVECKNARVLNRDDIKDEPADVAWANVIRFTNEGDLDEAKNAVASYVKAIPDITYAELEASLRRMKMGLHLIAVEKPGMLGSITNMDLQGNLDKKYQVTYRFSDKPSRPKERPFWPKDAEENLERLKDAGEPVSRGIPKCSNCSEYGHISKACSQPKMEAEQVVIKCYNCDEEGHRVRDCPIPREDKFACKNCGESGHRASDCPQPRKAGDDVECRKCGGMGHYSRDCPEGGEGGGGGSGCFNCGQEGHRAGDCPNPKVMRCRNCNGEGHQSRECPEPKDMSKVQCRNCDEFGHESRGCPKPRDYSRVKCSNCGEMGHTKVRCKNATVDPEGAMMSGMDEMSLNRGGGDGDFPTNSGMGNDAGAGGLGGGGDW